MEPTLQHQAIREADVILSLDWIDLAGTGHLPLVLAFTLIMGASRQDPLHKRLLRVAGSAWNDADSVSSPDLERRLRRGKVPARARCRPGRFRSAPAPRAAGCSGRRSRRSS